MVKLYMDAHVPWPIAKGLRERGIDVLTVQEDGRESLDDTSILQRAAELSRVLVSMDKDFRSLIAKAQAQDQVGCGVVAFSRKLSYRACIDDLELIAKCSDPKDWAGRMTYLPL
jgi:hypothetical protein